ncbi:putative E3 ubiquitin-protein ligase ATL44 [Cocos nucifera]|uniref:RING-type E3 ubiquitin transferase n=1 Tax=Cocos nucifera TaxID=13894 RepID=A0A8K0I0E8_COCNU|nr:putative E3 ubiquitin-protein ligase ATL44 [Cocos nucifera]
MLPYNFDLEPDASRFLLRTKSSSACNLRLTAFASGRRKKPSVAEAGIFFHLRHNRRWFDDRTIQNGTQRDLCHKSFFQDLDSLLDPRAGLEIFERMLLELDLGGVEKKLAKKWVQDVSWFGCMAAMAAVGMRAKMMTMVVEFSGVKIETYEDMDHEESEEEKEEEGEVCCICFEEMNKMEEQVEQLACSHSFHIHCIQEWFQRQQRCPLCRSEIH